MKRIEALRALAPRLADNPVVVTCAATSRELAHVQNTDNQFYLLDSMGLVGSVAAGLALALGEGGEKVVGIEGDGSLMMNPNVLFTNAVLQPKNLILILLDNHVFGSTGNLPTYADAVDLGHAAAALGHQVRRADDIGTMMRGLEELLAVDGPALLHVRIEVGNSEVPKLLVDPVDIRARFSSWMTRNYGNRDAVSADVH